MLLSLSGLDFITSISGAASSISNVGPGLGDIIGPNGNYKEYTRCFKMGFICWYVARKIRTFRSFSFIFFLLFWRN